MITEIDDVATGSMRELAWQYRGWGWSVVPLNVGRKKTSERWKRYQGERPPDCWIRSKWGPKSCRNVGIILGQASGDLLVRDFDDANDYLAWAKSFPGLAERLPTVLTRRGYHVYLKDQDGYIRSHKIKPESGAVGELRGDGNFVVAAGSTVWLDDDGTELEPFTYNWTIPPEIVDGMPIIPTVSLLKSGLVPETLQHQHAQH